MAERPNELPIWAENGGADVTTPSLSKRNTGWFIDESPAADFVNWLSRSVGKWVHHIGSHVSTFDTLLDACDPTGEFPIVVGETCFIDEGYNARRLLQPLNAYDPEVFGTSAKSVRSICSDGRYLYIVSASNTNGNAAIIRRILREDGSVDGSWSVTTSAVMTNGGGVVWDLWTDGVVLAFASSAAVEVFNVVAGGVAIWSKAYTSSIRRRVTVDPDRVYVTDGDDLIAYTRTNGTLEWTFDHGATVWAAVSDGWWVYLFGATSAHASLSDLRKLTASTGDSATVEGGTAVGTSNEWDFAFSTSPVAGGDLRLGRDGELFLSYDPVGAGDDKVISRRSSNDGSEVWTSVGGAVGLFDLAFRFCVDDNWIWGMAVSSGGTTVALSYGGVASDAPIQVSTSPIRIYGGMHIPCSDGSFVWSAAGVIDSGFSTVATLSRWSRGSTVRHWRRVDPAARVTLPLQQLIIPA